MLSKSRPFVSGTAITTKTAANAQKTEYIQNVPAVVINCNRLNETIIIRENIPPPSLYLFRIVVRFDDDKHDTQIKWASDRAKNTSIFRGKQFTQQ